jgi:hypothetical protein
MTRLRLGTICVMAIGVVFAIAAFVVSGIQAAASVMVGAALAAANLTVLGKFIARTSPGKWGLVAAISMVGQLAIAFLALKLGLADPLPFVVGCAALPAGLVLGSVLADRLLPPEE